MVKKSVMFSEARIIKCPSGDYKVGVCGGEWSDEGDLLSVMREDNGLLELGVDVLPSVILDIRGKIHNESLIYRLFAFADGSGYTSICKR